MKKITITALILSIIVLLFGCEDNPAAKTSGNKSTPSDSSGQSTTPPAEDVLKNTVEIDNIIFTVKGRIEKITGDRDENGEIKENGDYFESGVELHNVNEYKNLILTYTIENKSQSVTGYRKDYWNFATKEGLPLPNTPDYNDLKFHGVEANKKEEIEEVILLEADIGVNKIEAVYKYLDYSEEYWSDYNKTYRALEMPESEFNEKYKPVEIKFEIDIENDFSK